MALPLLGAALGGGGGTPSLNSPASSSASAQQTVGNIAFGNVSTGSSRLLWWVIAGLGLALFYVWRQLRK